MVASQHFIRLHLTATLYCVQLLLDLSGNISAVTIQDGMTMDIHKDNFLFKLQIRDTVGRSSMKSFVAFFNCEGGECKLI